MKLTKRVACFCIFSTLFMGCYSSSMIYLNGPEKQNIHAGSIEYVVTRDGKKYEFAKPPDIANDKLVGEATVIGYTPLNQERTSILLSDVALVGKSDSGNTEYVVTKVGAKYMYDEPPTTVNGVVVGKAKFAGLTPMQVSIPLSDILRVEASQFDLTRTIVCVVSGCVLVAVVTYGLVLSSLRGGLL